MRSGASAALLLAGTASGPGEEAPDFYAEVQPVLVLHWHKCHV